MNEIIFYNEQELMVTSARLVIGKTLFPLRGIVMVEMSHSRKKLSMPSVMMGMLLMLCGMFIYALSEHWLPLTAILAGFLCVMAALIFWYASKDKHTIQITLSSGDQHVVMDVDQEKIRRLFKAMNDAVREAAH